MTKYILFSFCLVLIYPLGVDLHLTGLTAIANDLDASEATLHQAFSIYLMGMVSSMLVAGWCSDNLGRKPIVLLGTVIFLLASFNAGISVTENNFLIARFFQGIGAGFCYVVTFAILRDTLAEKQRAKVLSMINGITCIIPVLAPVLGFLILLKFKWPVMFYAMAIYALLIFIYCFFGIKETKPKQWAKNKNNTITGESFLNSFFLSRLLISCLGMSVILTYVNISPIVIMQQMHYTTGQYSTAITLLSMVSMATSFMMPKILTKLRYETILYTGLSSFLGAVIFLFIGKNSDPRWFFTSFSLCGAGFALLFGIIMSQALSPFSQRAGLASSILGISQLSFASLYIWTMGWLGISAINMLMVILSASCLIGFTFLHLFRSSGQQQKVNCDA
ncbi:MFS transporter [Proteus sp. WDL240414]|uniref:MFS transporter n=2 Tax=Proteus TaxID=583 RepID=A0A6I7D8L8_9GAMM|nr:MULTISPECIES: MFS transporter [Proteus]MBG2801351.1 MFS transporter [Proteus mirabilis]MBG3018730.1 MFS transporter [Proteus mirabilis]MBG3152757.1 MFS transporter [Proteus mirabilis]QHN10643.1 MFS transporter [Proteus columbae]